MSTQSPMQVRAIKFAALVFASAAALAFPSASFGQMDADVRYWVKFSLNEGIVNTMSMCNSGRSLNRSGYSMFERSIVSNLVRPAGMSTYDYAAMLVGQALAMSRVCPDVRLF